MKRTQINGTRTKSHGWIPHLHCETACGVKYLAPVKLAATLSPAGTLRITGGDNGAGPDALERNGRLVFALPGGGEVLF